MTDNKKYIINVGDQNETWDSDMFAEKGDALFAKYQDANVFEVEDAEDFDEDPTDKQYIINVGENSEVWDGEMVKEKGARLKEVYPDAKIQRVSYKDYWGEAAEANRAKKAELQQPDQERNARLAELGYYDDLSEGQKEFDINQPNIGLKPLSSAIETNSVSGETKYLDPNVQEFFAKDTAYTERMAEIARLDEEYDANPSVIAQREYEAQIRADKEKYVDEQIESINKEISENVDALEAGKGAMYRSKAPGASDAAMGAQIADMFLGNDPSKAITENRKMQTYASALKLFEKAKQAEDVAGKGFWGATADVAESKAMDLFTQSDIEAYAQIGDILTRLEKEVGDLKAENITEEVFDKYLTKEEQALIKGFFAYNEAMANASQDMSKAYKGGKIFGESIGFMLEFLATGGLAEGAGKAATGAFGRAFVNWAIKAARGTASRAIRKGVVKGASALTSAMVGTLARTAVAPGTYKRMAEESVKIEDGHLHRGKNAFKAFADSYIENLSEISGGLIGKSLGMFGVNPSKILGKVSFGKIGQILADNKVVQGIFGKEGLLGKNGALQKLGFNGIFEEVEEEYIGNLIREFTIQDGALAEMHKDGNFGAMLIGFAPMTLFGATMSAARIGAINLEASNLGKKLRETLSAHYNDEQIEHMMNLVREAKDADEVQKALEPLAVGLNQEELTELYQYGAFMALNNTAIFTKKAQEDTLAQAKRAQLQQTYNKFWQTSKEGAESVQIANLRDGRTVFVVSEPSADGVVSIIDAQTNEKGFTNVSNYATSEENGVVTPMTRTWSMDAYLEAEIASERMTAEQARMTRERDAQIQNLQSQIQEGTKINLGTEGNPVMMVATGQFVQDGVLAMDQTGSVQTIGWNQVADAMKQPIKVKTDQQIIDEEMAAIVERNAKRRKQMTNQTPAMTEAVNESASQSAEVVAQENRYIPMNEDGTVNEAAFWEQDPEGYAQWNDEQNQDGGADTLEQIAISKAMLTEMLSEAQKQQMTSNPIVRKAAKQNVADIEAQIARLNALEASYQERRVAPFRERAMKWKSLTNAPVHIVETAEELAAIDAGAARSTKQGSRVRGIAKDGKAYIYLPGIIDEGEIDAVFMHEAVAHVGLKGMLGQEAFDRLCDEVWSMMSPEMQRVFINYPEVNGNTRAAADEYIAHLAEKMGAGVANAEEKTIWQKIVNFVREALRAMGINLNVSESELSDLIHQAYANLAENMAKAEKLGEEEKTAIEAEARQMKQNSPASVYEQMIAGGLTAEEIRMVAQNDLQAAKDAYDAIVANAPKVEPGESSVSFIERKRQYNEQMDEAKKELNARMALMDEVVRRETPARRSVVADPVQDIEQTQQPDGSLRLSMVTYNDWTDNLGNTHKGTRSMVAERMIAMKFSDAEINDMLAKMDTMYNYMEKLRELTNEDGSVRFDEFNAWAEKTPLYKQVGRDFVKAITSLVSNGDYPINMELTTDCIKREAFTMLLNALVKRGADLSKMGPGEIVTIQKMMNQYGIEVACKLCFVEGKRLQIVNWASQIVEDWNNALVEAGVETNEYFGFGKDGDAFIPAEEWMTHENKSEVAKVMRQLDEIALLFQGIDPKQFKAQKAKNKRALEKYKKEKSEAWAKRTKKPASAWNPSKEAEREMKEIANKGLAPTYVNENMVEYKNAFDAMRNEWLDKNPGADPLAFTPTKKQWEALGKIRNRQIDTVKAKMVRLIMEYPEMRKKLTLSDLLGSKGLMEIRQQHGQAYADLYSIILQRFGTGTPKPVQDAVPYDGELMTLTESAFKKANEIGGARLFSFSDFDITKVFDYMQMFFDLEANRQMLQSYTKEVAAVIIFGRSNAKFNISTLANAYVPQEVLDEYAKAKEARQKELKHKWSENAGLLVDEAGNITGINFSEEHSVSPAFAQQIFHDDARNKDCGAIMVGASVNHAIYSAAQAWIRMVIPFHLSGMPKAAQDKTDVKWYFDNTPFQSTRKKTSEGWAKISSSEDTFKFYNDMNEPGWSMRDKTKQYLAWCKENGFRPKFDWGINSDYYRAYCEEQGYEPNQQIIDIMDADTTDGVWNQYYKFLTDFTAYKPVFNAQGEMIDEIPSPQLPVVSNFDFSEMEREVLFEGEDSMLGHREENIKKAERHMDALAAQVVPYLNGEITEDEMGLKDNVFYKSSTDAENYLEALAEQQENNTRLSVITPQQDADYLAAVERGDMEAAQRMVDEAAAAAGYTIRGEHGRVSKFTIFDRNKANPEGNWGQGFYFTNNEEDVEENYANVEGPDLEAKIEREVEKRKAQLEQDMDYDSEEDEVDEFAIREAVEKEFITAEPNVVHAAIKMDNPFVVGHGMVEIGEDGLGHYDMNETYLTVEYETDEEGEVDYEVDPTGTLVDLVDALNEEISEYDWANFNADEILGNNIDGMTAGQFEQEARELLERHIDYLTNDKGDIMTSEILRAAIERAGFDGIVDNTVNQKFGTARRYGRSMAGVDGDTRHYIAFESNQIKATDPVTYDDAGNVIPLSERFNPEESDIRFSVVFSSANEELNNTGLSLDNLALMQEYGLSAIELSKKGDYVTLSKIVAEEKGQGNGTRFMEDLTKNADANGWTLALTPDTTYGASSVSRLKKFYKRFGFKENKGKNTDFNTKESMIRIPEGQVMFSVREEGQSAEEFVSRQIDRFVRNYKPEAPIRIADLSSREACAKSLGLSMDDFTEKDYEETLEVAKTRAAAYSPEYKIVAIFVPEAIKNSIVADEIFFHETGHHFIKNNPHLIELGKWLFENSDNGVRRIIAESVREDYTEDRHYEEMLMNFAGKIMSRGRAQKVMDILPDDMKPLWEEFLTRSNYKTEYEDRVRRDLFSRRNGGNQAEYEGTQMRNRDVADRKRPRVTWTKDTRFSTTEITPEVQEEMDAIHASAIVMGNFMKAPNGQPTNLTEEQWLMVRTKGFKNWFGDWINDPENASKVVDENGEPKVVYHGTPWNPLEEPAGKAVFKSGWFTGMKNRARGYGEPVAVFLNIKNPAYSYDKGKENDTILPENFDLNNTSSFGEFDGYISYIDYPEVPRISKIAKRRIMIMNPENYEDVIKQRLAEEPRGRQFFSVIPKEVNQIKSATENTGEFSEENEDIRFSMTDSKGNTLTPEQERFFANSKAVDKDGNLLVLYHGTPRAGFTEFKSGWFTTSKEDAISYSGDRKGRLFDPNEKYEPETLIAGDFPLGYMTFDSEEDRAAFLERFPYADEVMSERDYEDARLGAEDEEYDALTARRGEFSEVWNAYREYERERFVDTTIGELVANPEAYTEEDFMRAMLEYDSNASFDNLDDLSAEERKDALVSALQYANEETEGGIFDMVVPTRVPRNGEGQKHNDLGNRTYEVYANIEKPYEIDANGRGSEFESGDIYKAVEDALADEQYDGVIIRNWKVGRTQQMGDVVVPKNGNQIKLTSNENPTKNSDIRFSAVSSEEFSEEGTRFSIVTDSALLDRLNSEPTIKVYRAMQLIDGKLYPPMSAYVDGVLREPSAEDQWEQAEENAIGRNKKDPSKVDLEQGKGDDGKRRKTSGVLYNPYFHTSLTPLNDQFSGAQTRSNLVIVEVEVPESELTSGYRAEGAANTVGLVDWHSGPIAGVLAQYEGKGRQVILSRWAKPVRIVPESEIADIAMKLFEGTTLMNVPLPSNVFTPALREELEKRGMEFVETTNNGKLVSDKRRTWSKTYGKKGFGKKPKNETRFSAVSTPTDEVVENGLNLSPARLASLAGDIFAALPEESRKKITDGLNGNILGLQDAILQIPTSLAAKENWNDVDKDLANIIRDKVQDAMEERGSVMSRPLTSKEALWMLYRQSNDSSDILGSARKSLVAYNLGFDPRSEEIKRATKDYTRYSVVANNAIDAATEMYNYETSLWTERLKESWIDMNQSVVALQNAMAAASGKPIEPWENIEYALNQLSSRSYADKKRYMRDFLKPLWDAVMDIVKTDHQSINMIERYMMLKHALERNKVFAKRDAREFYKNMYDKVADRMKNQSHAQQVVALSDAKKALADIDAQLATATNAQKKRLDEARSKAQLEVDIAELVLRGDEQQNETELSAIYDSIDNETNPKYLEYREKDYGGLTSMFVDITSIVQRKDFKTEEAYQKAVLAATKPKYDSVAEMESAAESEVSWFERNKDSRINELWARVNAATKEVLRHQHASGMITTEQYNAVRNMFKFYVPLRGFADNTAEDMYSYYMNNSSNGFAMPIMGAKGRKSRAESPLGWIGTMAESAIQADNKNEAKMKLYYALINRPNIGVLSIAETWYEYTGQKDANGKKIYRPAFPPATGKALSADELRQHMDTWEEEMKKKQAAGDAYKGTQRVNLRGAVVFQDTKEDKEHIIRVKVAGKDYSILVNGNPRAAQAINGLLNPDANVGPVAQWIGDARRNLSALLTSYSPLFWVANYQRDLLSSVMRMSEAYGWDVANKYMGNRRQAWRVISYIYKYDNGTIGDSYYETLYKEFAENGGITGYTALTTNKEYEKLLEDYAKSVDKKTLNWIKGVWDKFMGFGEAIEQVSRFAAYITMREAGKPIEEAINAAKEVSVNFNRKGSAKPISLEELDKLRTKNGKELNKVQRIAALTLSAMPGPMKFCYYFVNASIQALSSSAKLAKKSPGKATTWVGMYMGTSIALAMLNYLLSDDDDDEYLNLPDYLRHSTALVKVADGYYFKWSIPQEMRPFYAWADILVRKMMGKMPHKSGAEVGKEMALAASQWLPVNPFEAEDPLLSLVPDFASPLAEIKANTNAFGGKIYDDKAFKPEGVVKKIPAYRKATEKTGAVYVDIAEFLNDISGGNETIKGLINVNPAIMEHLIEGYGGGIYDFAKMMVSIPSMILSDDPVQIKEIPFVNKVILSVDETNMYSHTNEAFYHYKDIADNAKRVEKEYRESDDPSRAAAYREEEDWRIYLLYKEYERDFKDVKERLDNAVDKEEEDLLKQEQNILREMFLDDIAKGDIPEITFQIREDVKRFDKKIKEIMKPANDANKERLERKKAGDVDGMLKAIEKRDSLKDTQEYQRAEELNRDLKEIKEKLEELGSVTRGSQRDSVIGELQQSYNALKEKMGEL